MRPVPNDNSGLVRLAVAWFAYLPLVSKLLLSFGSLLMISGLFGWLPPSPILSFRLICLGLSWDYFFRLRVVGIREETYNDGPVRRRVWIEFSRVVGGIFFLAFALTPTPYLLWIYRRLSS